MSSINGGDQQQHQPQPVTTMRRGSLVTSLNPTAPQHKRAKLKENQMDLQISVGPSPNAPAVLLKRKLPLGNYMSDNIMSLATAAPRTRKESLAATPGRKRSSGGDLVVSAVERRNARERNRVQQVNNGFAALRERIPDEIAAAFEATPTTPTPTTPTTTARGIHKKLSKVETLRMAVEYIKCLERVLAVTARSPPGDYEREQHDGLELPATPPPEPSLHVGPLPPANFFLAIKPRAILGGSDAVTPAGAGAGGGGRQAVTAPRFDQTQITIINGHQYIRIPGTNTFQFLDPESLYGEDVLVAGAETGTGTGDYSEGEEDDDASCSSNVGDLLSESAIVTLSPESNFTLEPDSDSKRDLDLPSCYLAGGVACQPGPLTLPADGQSPVGHDDVEALDQQQQQFDADLLLIKSELESDADADLVDDPAFLSWIEVNQQLQLQQQLQLHQHQQQHQHLQLHQQAILD